MTWLTSQSFILYFFITSFFVSHSLIVQLCQFFLSFFITFFLSFSLTSQYLTSFFSLSHFLSDMSKWRITFQAPPPLLGIPSHTLIPLCKESLRLGDSIYPAIVKVPEFKKKRNENWFPVRVFTITFYEMLYRKYNYVHLLFAIVPIFLQFSSNNFN